MLKKHFFYNEPESGVGINPGMALTPLTSRIGRGSNPQPSNREPSALPLDTAFATKQTHLSPGRWVPCTTPGR